MSKEEEILNRMKELKELYLKEMFQIENASNGKEKTLGQRLQSNNRMAKVMLLTDLLNEFDKNTKDK